jgi:hypothetical protein
MLNTDDITPLFKYKKNIKRSYIPKKNTFKLISPKNYSWKELFKMMNKIKYIWHMKKFDVKFTLDMQSLNKCMYTNLKYCEKMPNLNLINNILITELNSFFQKNLFDYLIQEQEIYDYYDNLFKKKKYLPKNDVNIFFADFIIKYTDLYYSINKNKRSMRQLKKLRWYIVMDEDNYFEDESKKYKNNSDFLFDFSKDFDNNDSFDEIETKKAYDEYLSINKNKIVDSLDEKNEENIINDNFINKLLNNENNPLFYIIKLIFLSISIFCKATVCHLLNSFTNIGEDKCEEGKLLINEYLLNFNNFVDSCLIINKRCENINVVMNFLYESLFPDYPKFPRFSIFRMCLRIWFSEVNTHLIGNNTLLSTISKQLVSIFSININEELFNKMEDNLNNKQYFNTKSVNYEKSKSFGLNTSFMLFKSDNISLGKNKYLYPFGTSYINTYDNADKIYKILEKGLSIINDTYSNEYSVYTLHLSSIDTNSFYMQLENDFSYLINKYITKIFDVYLTDKKEKIKEIIDNILLYFDNSFFKTRIFSNLKKTIYDKVHSELKNNLLKFVKNEYLEEYYKNKKLNNFSHKSKSNSSSTRSNISFNNTLSFKSNLKSSLIFDFNNDFDDINFNQNTEKINDEIKNEIINYIMKNISIDTNIESIENNLEEMNEKINLYNLFITIEDWYNMHINEIKGNDQRIKEELKKLNRINSLSFDQFKRYLLSYSLQYDWAFIKKVKNVEQYLSLKNDDIEMKDNNNTLNYFNDLNNIGNAYNNNDENENDINNFNNLFNIGNIGNTSNNNLGGFNLRSSFFE